MIEGPGRFWKDTPCSRRSPFWAAVPLCLDEGGQVASRSGEVVRPACLLSASPALLCLAPDGGGTEGRDQLGMGSDEMLAGQLKLPSGDSTPGTGHCPGMGEGETALPSQVRCPCSYLGRGCKLTPAVPNGDSTLEEKHRIP